MLDSHVLALGLYPSTKPNKRMARSAILIRVYVLKSANFRRLMSMKWQSLAQMACMRTAKILIAGDE